MKAIRKGARGLADWAYTSSFGLTFLRRAKFRIDNLADMNGKLCSSLLTLYLNSVFFLLRAAQDRCQAL